jgi:hypothetical protein
MNELTFQSQGLMKILHLKKLLCPSGIVWFIILMNDKFNKRYCVIIVKAGRKWSL